MLLSQKLHRHRAREVATCPKDRQLQRGNPVDYMAKFKKLWGMK